MPPPSFHAPSFGNIQQPPNPFLLQSTFNASNFVEVTPKLKVSFCC
jgi:hypothetical protein